MLPIRTPTAAGFAAPTLTFAPDRMTVDIPRQRTMGATGKTLMVVGGTIFITGIAIALVAAATKSR